MNLLVTGGTGSFGQRFIKREAHNYDKVYVYSRDEYKQSVMARELDIPNVRYLLGDVRDKDRLKMAFRDVDIVVHAAALKQVPTLEYNPTEAVKTNINGSVNIVEAAIECGVSQVIGLSTDKAVNPINLYGATKLAMEKVFMAAPAFNKTRFKCTRYGNVIGSRGSVIPLWQKCNGEIPITDPEMTRFWMTLDEAVDLVITAINTNAEGIFVPKMKSMVMHKLAYAIKPNAELRIIGNRSGEKKHESLISEDNKNVILLNDGNKEFYPKPFNSCEAERITVEEMRLCLK